ncbi:MAG: type IV pilin protein [bacterium]
MKSQTRTAFTLIELLIVVAIIGVLAAIAVPNFLNAQTRAKIARVMGDHQAVGSALELYQIDQNGFPFPRRQFHYIEYVNELTTPVAYTSSIALPDPFRPDSQKNWYPSDQRTVLSYQYICYGGLWTTYSNVRAHAEAYHINIDSLKGYSLMSHGPDKVTQGLEWLPIQGNINNMYSPSNGLYSLGDIARFGGNVQARTVVGG